MEQSSPKILGSHFLVPTLLDYDGWIGLREEDDVKGPEPSFKYIHLLSVLGCTLELTFKAQTL